MWQRFTERARKVVFYAQEEAQRFGEGDVSTEHVLLGLVREPDCLAARVLEELGISCDGVRAEVEKRVSQGNSRPSQDMTLTPRAKRIIDLAYDEARSLNNNYIGTEHLLLGVVREGDGLAGRILKEMGVEIDRARELVRELQEQEPSRRVDTSETPAAAPPTVGTNPPADPWARFDPSVRLAIVFSEIEALRRGQPSLSPEHLLLGMLQNRETPLVRFLPTVGLNVDALVEKTSERCRDSGTPIKGEATLSPATLNAIRIASQEQVRFRAKTLGLEHLFLGLMREPDGIVGHLFESLGLDVDLVRAEMVKTAWQKE